MLVRDAKLPQKKSELIALARQHAILGCDPKGQFLTWWPRHSYSLLLALRKVGVDLVHVVHSSAPRAFEQTDGSYLDSGSLLRLGEVAQKLDLFDSGSLLRLGEVAQELDLSFASSYESDIAFGNLFRQTKNSGWPSGGLWWKRAARRAVLPL